MFTYLIINILTILGPLSRSFENKIKYYKYWKNSLLPAILIPLLIFIIWDVIFTKIGVWSFNNDYITGFTILNLPIEEWLFFITIPFACIFIYEVYCLYRKKVFFKKIIIPLLLILSTLLIITGLFHLKLIYTSITFIATGIFILILIFIKNKEQLSDMFVAYLISLVPFFIVNGILTFLPIVSYNNHENLSIRLFTIPIEDAFYLMLLLFMNIAIYQKYKNKN